jgi:signal transduction histidine kinase
VAHDLKNPLTATRIQAQLMTRRAKSGRLDTKATIEGLATIDINIVRMAQRIDELSDVARLRLGRLLELRREPTDLVEMAEELVTTWSHTSERHRISLETEQPSLFGDWDEVRLARVLDNLLSNAVKYSPNGGEIVVKIAQKQTETGEEAELSVRDQGLGVPAKDLPRIFDRFSRAGNVAEQVAGTGIGLSGSKRIVEQHGGTIAIESEEGRGTLATVILPLSSESTSVK